MLKLDYEEHRVSVFYKENSYVYIQCNISICALHIHIIFNGDTSLCLFLQKKNIMLNVDSSLF